MKRVLFWLLGFLLLIVGLLVEALIIWGIFTMFKYEWSVLVITILIFSIIIGNIIYKYGFKSNIPLEENKQDTLL
nr:hypothetical protein [uncultured Niameybacter sp.]